MIIIGSSLALLVIYAGIKLLIQVKRESLSHLFRFAAGFFIVAGFLTLACAGACCIAMCCKYGSHMMHKEHKMMAHDGYDGYDGDNEMYHHRAFSGMGGHYRCDKDECSNCKVEGTKNCCDPNGVCKIDTAKYKR
jgi:hypothetical protein